MTFSRAVGQLLQARRGVPAQVCTAVWNPSTARRTEAFTRLAAAGMTLLHRRLQASFSHDLLHEWCRAFILVKTPKAHRDVENTLHLGAVVQSQRVALRNRDVSEGAHGKSLAPATLRTALARIVPGRPHYSTAIAPVHAHVARFLLLTQAQATSRGRHGKPYRQPFVWIPPAAQLSSISPTHTHMH